jgi:Protein of unknown function (DUF3551)
MRGLILSSGLLVAALVAGPQAAVAQAGGKAFCLESSSGSMNCAFDSLAQCEQRRSSATGGACVPNPAGTTGAGGGARDPAAPPNPPGGGQYLPPPSSR